MKKTLALAVTALALTIGASTAFAGRTIALCELPYKKLKSHGFTQSALYNEQQVKAFFKVVNVEPEDLSQLHPGVRYMLNYDCHRDKGGVAHASLQAVETPTPAGMLTPNTVTVQWEFTK